MLLCYVLIGNCCLLCESFKFCMFRFSLHSMYFSICLFNSSDEFQNFFSKYGKVVEHQIIRDHETNRSRGFGFIIFDSDEVVDEILSNGNMIDMAGTQVSLSRWTPRNQHVNQSLFIMEHAPLHSPFIFMTCILRVIICLVLRYLIKEITLVTVTNSRWRLLQVLDLLRKEGYHASLCSRT
jgi:hypothetical protein